MPRSNKDDEQTSACDKNHNGNSNRGKGNSSKDRDNNVGAGIHSINNVIVHVSMDRYKDDHQSV